jgi:prophage tail gpP-like protein
LNPLFRGVDVVAPEAGVNAWEFLDKLARKRQVLLNSNAEGNLVIRSRQPTYVEASVLHRVADNNNNVLRYSASNDSTGRFNFYVSTSQVNLVALSSGAANAASLVDLKGTARDTAIRIGRQKVLAESSYGGTENEDRAKWEANIRRARGQVYSATVHGYRNQTGELWTPNTIVYVADEYVEIDRLMLINSVMFGFDGDAGRTTTLGLIEKDAYTLELIEPVSED